MASNLEIKVTLPSFVRIKSLLTNLGAEFHSSWKQKDIYYQCSNGLLKLRIQDSGNELIYYNRAEKAKKRWSEYFILSFQDENPDKFFTRAFGRQAIVEKERTLYIYGNTRIHLDKVKNLGLFLELESVVKNSKKSAEAEFRLVHKSLELHKYPELRKSYSDLIIEKGTKP